MTAGRAGLGLWLAALVAAGPAGAAKPPANLVANPSFERVDPKGAIADWIPAGEGVALALTSAPGRAGGRAAKLVCSAFARTGSSSHAMLAQVGKVALRKGVHYTLVLWLKADGIRGRQAEVAIKDTTDWNDVGLGIPLRLTRGWTRYEAEFTASRDVAATSRLQLWYGETGTLWVDDVALTETPPVTRAYTHAIPPGPSRNLIPNASFELGTDGWGSSGSAGGWGSLNGLTGEIRLTADAPDGSRALMIPVGPGRSPVLWVDYFDAGGFEQRSPLAESIGWITVARNAPYTFSVWMKADPPGTLGRLVVRQGEPADWPHEESLTVTLTGGWRRYALTVWPHRTHVAVAAGPDLRGDPQAAATVWLDAFQLEAGREATDPVPREPVELGLSTDRPGNVFHRGEPVRITASIRNSATEGTETRVVETITDTFGRRLPLDSHAVDAPANGVTDSVWALKLPGTGVYDVVFGWTVHGVLHRRPMRLTVIDPYEPADSPFGVNHAPAVDDLARLLRDAGVTWARDWTLKWQAIEPEPGRFAFGVPDGAYARLRRLGMRILPLLPPFPSANWASSAPAGVSLEGYPGVRKRMAYAPRDPARLAAFIDRTVRHYDPGVTVWEFLNEPVYTDYALPNKGQGLPGADYAIKDYVALLKVASAAMKGANRDARVIGGIAGWPDGYATTFIEQGGLGLVDILNLHLYPGKAPPESLLEPMAKLAEVMKAHGGIKPIWVTEEAYYGADDLPWTPYGGGSEDWAGSRLLADELEAAAYEVRFAVVMLASGVEKIFTHSGANAGVNEPSLECPWLGDQGVPRKAYAAQAALASLLGPEPKIAGRLQPPAGGDGLYAFAFQCGTRAVVVAWADDADPAWTFAVPRDASLRDLAGNPLGFVGLGAVPEYVVREEASAADLLGRCRWSRRGG